MKLIDLMTIADQSYPDNLVIQHYNPTTGRCVGKTKEGSLGDTLAEFICKELCDTFDSNASDEQQLDEAVRVMNGAIREITAVRDGFAQRRDT